MHHITYHAEDVPAIPCLVERRRTPDRRVVWRGGRRDTDWQNRPEGAWALFGAREAGSTGWSRLLSALHIW